MQYKSFQKDKEYVSIEEKYGFTRISNYLFYNYTSLASFIIKSSISSRESVNIPTKKNSIRSWALYGLHKLLMTLHFSIPPNYNL